MFGQGGKGGLEKPPLSAEQLRRKAAAKAMSVRSELW